MNSVLQISPAAKTQPIQQEVACPPELTTLVYAIATGEVSAFEKFYEFTVAKIFSRAMRIVSCRATAEEVVEDVFVQIWQTAEKYDASRATPLGWAMTICQSRALDALRRADKAILDPAPTERLDALTQQPMTNLQDILQTSRKMLPCALP